MDNHPIPQDVTHFQFKLVGNLTLKQFGYIGAGVILGWITISLPVFILLKLPFALIFLGTGLTFAFIPIEGRPADMMLSYFFQALFQPNQYLYQKEGSSNPLVAPIRTNTQRATVTTQPISPTPPPVQMQRQQMPTSQVMPAPIAMPMQSPALPQMPTIQQPVIPAIHVPTMPPIATQPPVMAAPSPAPVTQQTAPTIQAIPATQPATVMPSVPTVQPVPQSLPEPKLAVPEVASQPVAPQQQDPMQDQLQKTLEQKKQLEEQLAQLKKQLEQNMQPQPTQEPVVQQAPTPKPVGVSPVVKTIPNAPKPAQTPMVSDFPNIIMGVVKDARGNVLPNILIEVKDNDDNPVRAFKTNPLGQFASATPLLNGIYTVVFEDPAATHRFDAIQIEVKGEIMQPIEIISKDDREDLRKELFG